MDSGAAHDGGRPADGGSPSDAADAGEVRLAPDGSAEVDAGIDSGADAGVPPDGGIDAGFDAGLPPDGGTVPAWIRLSPSTGPLVGRQSFSAVYDAPARRMVVFGGHSGTSMPLNTTESLSVSDPPNWSVLTPSGGPPLARFSHAAAVDEATRRMIVFGGFASDGFDHFDLADTWSLELGPANRWTRVQTNNDPPARSSHSAAIDSQEQRLVVFGGFDVDGLIAADVWTLPLAASGSWNRLTPLGSPRLGRASHSAVYDGAGQRMIVFGGLDDAGLPTNEVLSLSLGPTPNWSRIFPQGEPPGARSRHSAVLDSDGRRMIVFGGDNQAVLLNDVWALTLSDPPAWRRIATVGPSPPERADHAAVYDGASRRLIVFGGATAGNPTEIWSLYLPAEP